MAAVQRYVDTASAGGDGTTQGHSGSTAAYASLSSWESSEQTDLVSATDTHTVSCAGSTADTTNVSVSGWTTNSSYFITIEGDRSAPDGDGFYGGADIRNTGYYRLETTSSHCITAATTKVVVDGIQFYHNATSNGIACISVAELSCAEIYVYRCRFYGDPGQNVSYGISNLNQRLTNAVLTVDSCFFAGFAYTLGTGYNGRGITCGFRSSQTTGTINIYNNSFAYIADYGIAVADAANNSGNTVNIKNNAVKTIITAGQDIDFSAVGANTVLNVDNNATDDDISSTDSNWVDLSSTAITAIFNAPGASPSASSDLHKYSGGPLDNAGLSVGETTDVDDDTRSTTYDIGADWAAQAGGGTSINVTAGALSFTGGSVSVNAERSFTTTAGALSFTGGSVTVTLGRRMLPSGGALSFTGGSPSTNFARFISPSAGSLSMAGQAATFIYDRIMSVVAAALSFTGGTPTVSVSGTQILPSAGTVSFTGGQVTGLSGVVRLRRLLRSVGQSTTRPVTRIPTDLR